MKIFGNKNTHFNHANIIKYCNRPFNNTIEMNEYIIQKWNSIVKNDDKVYHVGDVGFGSVEDIKNLIESLNGTKILLRGNHDKLEDNYEYALYSSDEKTQTIKKLEKTNEESKNNIANKILQTLEPKLKKMTLSKLEFLYKELNYEDVQLKEIYYSKSKDCEEIYLSKGELMDMNLLDGEKNIILEKLLVQNILAAMSFANINLTILIKNMSNIRKNYTEK